MLLIRNATVNDVPVLRRMICELAEYAKKSEQVRTTEMDIARDGFGRQPEFRALIAEWGGEAAGFAVFLNHYSTWSGAGLYLEDLFVRHELRRKGIGKTLISEVARVAAQENRVFLRWVVLDWNQPAISLYKKLGADFLDKWRTVVLAGESLRKLTQPTPVACTESLTYHPSEDQDVIASFES
jgi:GNAT superfamily N-acetyltransferase